MGKDSLNIIFKYIDGNSQNEAAEDNSVPKRNGKKEAKDYYDAVKKEDDSFLKKQQEKRLEQLRSQYKSEEEIQLRVEEAAEFAGLDKELLERSPFDISGGQKRRAAIAGIIAMRPDVLVLDEPAAGLDPRGRDAIFNNIMEYQKKSGSTVIIVSHSMEDMARLCDNLVVMANGEIFMEGDRASVFGEYEKLTTVGLDIPQITQLMNALAMRGINVDKGIYTVEQAFEFINNYKGKR